ncbi:MAG: 1-acyl-sn-glycerol-3-phosphate acyltransferase [Verrucomicrobiota bacterium]
MKYLARLFFRLLLLPPIQLLYRVRRLGAAFVPREGGVLLLGNHVSYLDSFVVFLTCPRPVRFVVLERYVKAKGVGWFLRLFGAIPIHPERAREAISRTVEALQQGDVVCLFPEGGLTRLGVIGEFKKGFELIVRKSGCQVVPFYMDGLWRSIFSFERGSYFRKWPHGLTCPLQVAFGRPLAPEEATVDRVRIAVMEQSVEAFGARRDFNVSMEKALVGALKKRRRHALFVEYGKNGPRSWSRSDVLGMATTIARRWMNQPPDQADRVGIMLPPGPMASVLNLGLFLAGKTPVNLAFTLDQKEMEETARSIAPLGIQTVITSRAFMPHLVDFWRGDEGVFIDMKSVISSPANAMGFLERIRAKIEPAWFTCWRLDLNRRTRDREAVWMVPVPGEEAISLSVEELHRNVIQVQAADFVRVDEHLFSEEPLARPEGLMLGCWCPALGKGKAVGRSFSLRDSFEALESVALQEEVSILVGSRSLFGEVHQSLSIRSIEYGLLFGRANQWEIEEWEETLDFPIARAWSSQGRVITMSRTDPNDEVLRHHHPQDGRRPRSVGRFLPGIAAEVRDLRLWMRFDPTGRKDSDGNWVEGPPNAEIDSDGFLFLPEAEEIDAI